jgi:hypothetical protein
MAEPDEIVEWTRAQIDEDERVAQAVRPLDHVYDMGGKRLDDQFTHGRMRHAAEDGMVVVEGDLAAEWHFTRYSPASALGLVAAHRAILADILAEKHFVLEDDCWYTCRAATEERDGGETCNDEERGKACDCGRDARVLRRVRLLAAGYAGRDGYDEAWRPR